MLSPFVGPLAFASGDGTAVAASAAETSLLTAAAATGKWAMPGGFFMFPGQKLRLRAHGRISTPGATQGNMTFKAKIGAVAIATSPTLVSLASQVNISWWIDLMLALRAVGDGTLSNFMPQGNILTALVSATNLNNFWQATAPAVGTGFDGSTGAAFDFTATWSNATAGNSIQLHDYTLESLV